LDIHQVGEAMRRAVEHEEAAVAGQQVDEAEEEDATHVVNQHM